MSVTLVSLVNNRKQIKEKKWNVCLEDFEIKKKNQTNSENSTVKTV